MHSDFRGLNSTAHSGTSSSCNMRSLLVNDLIITMSLLQSITDHTPYTLAPMTLQSNGRPLVLHCKCNATTYTPQLILVDKVERKEKNVS